MEATTPGSSRHPCALTRCLCFGQNAPSSSLCIDEAMLYLGGDSHLASGLDTRAHDWMVSRAKRDLRAPVRPFSSLACQADVWGSAGLQLPEDRACLLTGTRLTSGSKST
ncbi:hypothetical protein EYF80_005882 [Liparis tanakae]|uniref:Uncharacterized protein n=1 Tax=Liparis tanakae TaxID=230148 RepID=A0A4Z2J232_9TELE|nr:hypothetical protein EYF80_005882 [Liparis tanakae]